VTSHERVIRPQKRLIEEVKKPYLAAAAIKTVYHGTDFVI